MIVRPLAGIESNKYQPIIRALEGATVAVSPYAISPMAKRITEFYFKPDSPASPVHEDF